MDQGPLVSEQIEAGAKFVREFDKYAPVQAAFWLKASEERQWYLYIASDQINDSNVKAAYGEVLRLTGKIQDPWLDPFQVKLVGMNDGVAQAVLEIQRKYLGKIPMRYHGPRLGGVSVEEAYIYPLPIQ
jgi:hypothetical protein